MKACSSHALRKNALKANAISSGIAAVLPVKRVNYQGTRCAALRDLYCKISVWNTHIV